MGNLAGGIFLSGDGNLTMSGFDDSNLSQSQKKNSVNIEHRLKSKLERRVCEEYEDKIKWYRSNDYS